MNFSIKTPLKDLDAPDISPIDNDQLSNENLDLTETFAYRYGYEFFGPVFAAYVHRLIETVRALKLNHILFVAREGYLFQRLYEQLEGCVPELTLPDVTVEYAYLSRSSTLAASAPQLTTREIELVIDDPDRQGLVKVIRALGLPVESFRARAAIHGLDIDLPVGTYWQNQPLLSFLNDVEMQAMVGAHCREVRSRLFQYLNQCGFWGKGRRVGLVDIGWQGTIQDNLVRAFNQQDDFPIVHGLYFGRRELHTYLRYSSSFSHGLIYDARDQQPGIDWVSQFVGILESTASAPHGSTVGYAEEAGQVVPMLKAEDCADRVAERAIAPVVSQLQSGIFAFAQTYRQQLRQQAFDSETGMPQLARLLTRHIAFPTRKEAQFISEKLGAQTLGLGSEGTSRLVISPQSFWQAVRRGNFGQARSLYEAAVWKSGSLRLIGGPVLLWVYWLKRRVFG